MFCYLFYYTGRHTFGFAVPGLEREFGFTKEQIGWIGGGMLLAYGAGQFFNGSLGDRFGGRLLMTSGAVLSSITCWILSRLLNAGGNSNLVVEEAKCSISRRYEDLAVLS